MICTESAYKVNTFAMRMNKKNKKRNVMQK